MKKDRRAEEIIYGPRACSGPRKIYIKVGGGGTFEGGELKLASLQHGEKNQGSGREAAGDEKMRGRGRGGRAHEQRGKPIKAHSEFNENREKKD